MTLECAGVSTAIFCFTALDFSGARGQVFLTALQSFLLNSAFQVMHPKSFFSFVFQFQNYFLLSMFQNSCLLHKSMHEECRFYNASSVVVPFFALGF